MTQAPDHADQALQLVIANHRHKPGRLHADPTLPPARRDPLSPSAHCMEMQAAPTLNQQIVIRRQTTARQSPFPARFVKVIERVTPGRLIEGIKHRIIAKLASLCLEPT